MNHSREEQMYHPKKGWYKGIISILKSEHTTENKNYNLRKVIAFHEAGHTLIAIDYELLFESCELISDETGETRLSESGGNARSLACFHVAGIVSQYLNSGDYRPWDYCNDFIQLICLIDFHHADFPIIVDEVIKHVKAGKERIRLITDDLLIRNKLYYNDLERLKVIEKK